MMLTDVTEAAIVEAERLSDEEDVLLIKWRTTNDPDDKKTWQEAGDKWTAAYSHALELLAGEYRASPRLAKLAVQEGQPNLDALSYVFGLRDEYSNAPDGGPCSPKRSCAGARLQKGFKGRK